MTKLQKIIDRLNKGLEDYHFVNCDLCGGSDFRLIVVNDNNGMPYDLKHVCVDCQENTGGFWLGGPPEEPKKKKKA